MRNSFLLLVFTFITSVIHAQSFTTSVSQSEVVPSEKYAFFEDFLGADDRSFYLLRVKKRGIGTKYFIEKYDKKTYKQEFSVDLMLNDVEGAMIDPKKFKVSIKPLDNELYVFFGQESDGERSLLFKKLSKDGRLGTEKVLATGSKEEDADFSITFSPDSSLLLVVTEQSFSSSKSNPNVQAEIYRTDNFQSIKKVELPSLYGKGRAKNGGYCIDDEGNMVFSVKYYKGKVQSRDDFGLSLGIILFDSKKYKIVDLNLPDDKKIYNGIVKINPADKTVSLTGLYKKLIIDTKKHTPMYLPQDEEEAGFYHCAIGLSDNVAKVIKVTDFSDDIVAKFKGWKSAGRNDYNAQDVFVKGDFNYFIVSQGGAYRYGNSSVVNLRENEIMIFKYDKAGNVEWQKMLPKATLDKCAPFNFWESNGDLYFLHLEHPKNTKEIVDIDKDYTKETAVRYATGITGPTVVCIKVTPQGKTQKTKVYTNEGFCMILANNTCLLEKNTVLVRFISGALEKYGVVKIQD